MSKMKDHLDRLTQAKTTRRGFLRNTSLAAVASAGAIALHGTETTHAAPQSPQNITAAAMAPTADDLPADARVTLQMVRSLTLVAMSALLPKSRYGETVREVGLQELKTQLGDLQRTSGKSTAALAWEPGDDICPPWWPFPWPPHHIGHLFDKVTPWDRIPELGRAAINVFNSLSLYNLAFQHADLSDRVEMQQLALQQLEGQITRVSRAGGVYSWEPGDGICPDWWPFPWKRPIPIPPPEPTPWPWRTLEAVTRNLHSYVTAMRFENLKDQQGMRALLSKQIERQVGKLGGLSGGSVGWEPGDDICPPHWPWPWPWPGPRLGPDPLPWLPSSIIKGLPEHWQATDTTIQTAVGVFRDATVFAIGSTLTSLETAVTVRDVALGSMQEQIGQLGI